MMNFKEWLLLENMYNTILNKVLYVKNLQDLLMIKDYLEENNIDQRVINCFIEKDKISENQQVVLNNLINVGRQLKPLPNQVTFAPENETDVLEYKLHNNTPDLEPTWIYMNKYSSVRIHHLRRKRDDYFFESIVRLTFHEEKSSEMEGSIEEILNTLPDFYNKKEMFNFLLCIVLIETIEAF